MHFEIMKFHCSKEKGKGDVVTASIKVRCPGYQMIAELRIAELSGSGSGMLLSWDANITACTGPC